MKDLKWYHWIIVAAAVFILILIFNEKARANFNNWLCNVKNKGKVKGDSCTNCVPPGSKIPNFAGIIDGNGNCVQDPIKLYQACLSDNASKPDGTECSNCVAPAGVQDTSKSTIDGYVSQYKGVIVEGKCMPLPDAFSGKICVPNTASVTTSALSYKRVLQTGAETDTISYKYFKTPSNTVRQSSQTLLDTEITKDDYIQAYVQTIRTCPEGQVKV